MSRKNYPTRMHEVLGVEVDEEFEIIDYPGVTFLVPWNGWMYVKWPSGKKIAGQDYWASAINHGIIRKPRLSEEQVKQLGALVVFDKSWISKDKDGSVFAFKNKPERDENKAMWIDRLYEDAWFLPGTSALADLVSWSDPAPLDIVATLKAAGVEVE